IWICQGAKSLHDLAGDSLGGPVHQVLQLTAEYSPARLFSPGLSRYLNGVFAADSGNVPAGATVYCPRADGSVVPVTSPGDQPLRALSEARGTQCSSIVRATAEHSPGGKFADDLAAYLDTVFSTSA